MKRFLLATLLTASLAAVSSPASAALKVLACEPEWGALAQELGGDKVDVTVATTALQDPHHVQAKPSLIARARNAELLACTGAGLEVGWLPILIQQSGNPAIQPGKPGNFAASDFVQKLDVPTRVDRADGDVHPEGNPHIQTDPRNIAKVAAALSQRLAQIDAANAAFYAQRGQDFAKRWDAALARWATQAAPLRGMPILVQHKAWSYMENWLGLQYVDALEPKPGVEPTASHLQEILARQKDHPARLIAYAAYQDARSADWLAERARIPAVQLPFTVGGTPAAKDLFGLYDDTLARLLKGAGK
ncbi:zinc ABC transporter substrate-binding protein [Niveibacterium umoris]|uniref:Zinc/manganese transport system substrate-binding protein n=1 Tax=Niveibacterium umoris TaxID=1193620 RepID=A0A840BTL6_9RHOO|nr:zinc ABC transporter substrate-binding protein [Niveibacterium umoris]MBB4013697.1 zinc/manganese transport system substrate-binding protein [Niveibacterium umoris]